MNGGGSEVTEQRMDGRRKSDWNEQTDAHTTETLPTHDWTQYARVQWEKQSTTAADDKRRFKVERFIYNEFTLLIWFYLSWRYLRWRRDRNVRVMKTQSKFIIHLMGYVFWLCFHSKRPTCLNWKHNQNSQSIQYILRVLILLERPHGLEPAQFSMNCWVQIINYICLLNRCHL